MRFERTRRMTDAPGGERMALRRIPYDRLEPLIREHLSTEEDESTTRLIKDRGVARTAAT